MAGVVEVELEANDNVNVIEKYNDKLQSLGKKLAMHVVRTYI